MNKKRKTLGLFLGVVLTGLILGLPTWNEDKPKLRSYLFLDQHSKITEPNLHDSDFHVEFADDPKPVPEPFTILGSVGAVGMIYFLHRRKLTKGDNN